jgi:hypothetical protein
MYVLTATGKVRRRPSATRAAVKQEAREIRNEAYRRATAQHGEHLRRLAETGTSREDLPEYLSATRAHLADLWRLAQAASVAKQVR